MAFTLIADDTLYKKDTSAANGSWQDGVWIPSDSSSYLQFEGTWEPYQEGEGMFALPEGVSSTDAIVIYTDSSLVTADGYEGDAIEPDIVYIKDPEVYTLARPYKIHEKGDWTMNTSFTLFNGYGEYLAVRMRNP